MTLKITEVTKKFGNFTAVDNLSLKIPEGQIFGFLGANGAGKTTTFRMVISLLKPTYGKIEWNGRKINEQLVNQIGYLPEERGLYPKLKVIDQIVYLGRLKGMKKREIEKHLEEWLKRFKISEYKHKRVEELSKGNQQKIQFIAAVIHQPKILILDEPFSGLDPVNVELLKKAVIDLKEKGTTIVFSSHRMEHVEELCEYLCIMQKGSPIVHGNLKKIKNDYGKKTVFVQGEFDYHFLKEFPGVTRYKESGTGIELLVENQALSQSILSEVHKKGFVHTFKLKEPSLNDIFIDKVGASYE
ncbi:ABC transporter ATP-binding protein [Bacillus carboniphilus]|uniref:ABC transporter ATP-binding protein n=1 Tax=Bacillus carboniphilus TaxID=86663 RepID=A0ABY9JTU9_9BACI|nr:ABC transporter ATP-binding protein [Bacillus carboniphilus]WLR42832.1 ABC transporter ATP-binding protein [Bacillus carboniphilus]